MSEPQASSGPAAVRWRLFLRALSAEMDASLGADGRDALLRRAGRRMAAGAALPPVETLDALQAEINEVLADLGWGEARIALDEGSRALRIAHAHLPGIGSTAGPRGPWLSAVLEGLYTGWLGQQPDARTDLAARRDDTRPGGGIVLTYARAEDSDAPGARP